METTLHLSLLGTPRILSGGSTLSGFVSYKAQALLYYLAVTGRPHSRQTLVDLFWDKMRETDAAANLRTVLSNLRRLVGEHLIITRQTVAFNRDQSYWLDVDIFRDQLHNTKQGISDQVVAPLRTALDLYCGDFLEGFYIRDAPNFEEWVLGQRERLRQLALLALYKLATYDTACGRYAEAIACTTRLLDLDPWHEDGHRQMMLLLAYTGQRSCALEQYEICRRALERELGIKPSTQTIDLYNQILNGTVTPATSAMQPSPAPNSGGAGLEQHSAAVLAPTMLANVKSVSHTIRGGPSSPRKLWQSLDTRSSDTMAPAVGGELDLDKLLARCFSDSTIQVVMLKDPASARQRHMLQTVQRRCSTQPHSWLETTCLPSYQNSPLRPILHMIARGLCLQPDESRPVRFAKLLSILRQHGLESAEAAPYLLTLLSLPLDECTNLLNLYSSAQMESMLSALVSLIQALASKRPVVLLVKDIQWCDEFTFRALDLLAGSDLSVPILILLTDREAFGSAIDSLLQTPYPRISAA